MFGIGMGELLVILVIALLLFGANRLPEIARALGKAVKEFNKAAQGLDDEARQKQVPEKKDSPSEKKDGSPL
ncbi:MAG: twin-arginine translocase TatA/TatE family subunit [Candidatus Omnitrophica bacterium]|nr:twin-arginine translocase TatA/TatE family subunit [Candidatus Omnitrophota bacterium]